MKRIRQSATWTIAVAICLLCAEGMGQRPMRDTSHPINRTAKNNKTFPLTIIVEGPWAFYIDNAHGQLVLMTVDIPGHPRAAVRAQKEGANFSFGVYNVSLPVSGPGSPSNLTDIVNLSITPAQYAAILALPSSLKRYVVTLPIPDSIGENEVDQARVGNIPHPLPPASDYTTRMELSYTLTSLNGVVVTGNDNSGSPIAPVSLTLGSKIIYVTVGSDFIEDLKCDTHAKQAFKDLTGLFNQPLYVDYDPYDQNCPPPVVAASSTALTANGKDMKGRISSITKEVVRQKLGELRNYVSETVKGKRLTRLLQDILIITNYVASETAVKASRSKTIRALAAAMDMRRYFKGLPEKALRRDQMLSNIGAISVHIYNTGGKNCKAPMASVAVQ